MRMLLQTWMVVGRVQGTGGAAEPQIAPTLSDKVAERTIATAASLIRQRSVGVEVEATSRAMAGCKTQHSSAATAVASSVSSLEMNFRSMDPFPRTVTMV